ncbi:unnamed protein product [Rhizophagus irregularis]|nr:unnamed protein product [Rhizophagus irregularis]CAB5308532.1 unnamed protein product [Rhizophagus irregularis]
MSTGLGDMSTCHASGCFNFLSVHSTGCMRCPKHCSCTGDKDNINIEEVDRTKYANLNCCYNTVQNSSTGPGLLMIFNFPHRNHQKAQRNTLLYMVQF